MQPQAPAAPPAPNAPVTAVVTSDGNTVTISGDPYANLQAAKARVEVLREQASQLEEKRGELTQNVRELREQGLDFKGVEARIADVDAQLKAVDGQLQSANQQVAQLAAVPGSAPPEIPEAMMMRHDGPPEGAFIVATVFMVFVLAPISIAFARRLWKKGMGTVAAAIPSGMDERLKAIEHAVESIAVEVERIGEGQRFMSRVFTERQEARALGEGAAQPIEVAAREKVGERR